MLLEFIANKRNGQAALFDHGGLVQGIENLEKRGQIPRHPLQQVHRRFDRQLQSTLRRAQPQGLDASLIVELVKLVHDARRGPGAPVIENPGRLARRHGGREYQTAM